MNTRTFPRPQSLHRTDLSPVRGIRGRKAEPDVTAAAADGLPVFRLPPYLTSAAPRPAWHRSALDRLQPILTRYRD